jgi:hypothetical protein
MEKGKKRLEYRKASDWIASRLLGKTYTYVKFTNGYDPTSPFFIAEYVGFVIAKKAFNAFYDGLSVNVQPGDYIIILGKVTERGNIKPKPVKFKKYAKSITRVFRHKIW